MVAMRQRRLVGILERAILGAAMTMLLAIVERRMQRRGNRRRLARLLSSITTITARADQLALRRRV